VRGRQPHRLQQLGAAGPLHREDGEAVVQVLHLDAAGASAASRPTTCELLAAFGTRKTSSSLRT
jgi:hypothetical protein